MEMSPASFAGLAERFGIHEGYHEHSTGCCIDRNCRQQAVAVELGKESAAHLAVGLVMLAHAAALLQDNHRCRAKIRAKRVRAFNSGRFGEMTRLQKADGSGSGTTRCMRDWARQIEGDLPNCASRSPASFVTRPPGASAPGVFVSGSNQIERFVQHSGEACHQYPICSRTL